MTSSVVSTGVRPSRTRMTSASSISMGVLTGVSSGTFSGLTVGGALSVPDTNTKP